MKLTRVLRSQRQLPRPGAKAFSSRLQLSTLPPPDAAALSQPVGRPLPRPFCPSARVCERGGARRGLYLAPAGRTARSQLGRRSPSWVGGDGLGRRGRPGAALLLTTNCPPPTQPALPPKPRPPLWPAFQHDLLLPGSRTQGSLVCATFSTPTLLSSHAWGSSTPVFSLRSNYSQFLPLSPPPGGQGRGQGADRTTQQLVSNWSATGPPSSLHIVILDSAAQLNDSTCRERPQFHTSQLKTQIHLPFPHCSTLLEPV